jgi:hypothetical protein
MGLTGHVVVARSDGPLEQVPMLASIMGPQSPDAGVTSRWPVTTGWQAVEITAGYWDEIRLKELIELVRVTGAPASSAWVLDSDCAIVTGLAPGGRPWRVGLNVDTLVEYGHDDPEAILCGYDTDVEEYGSRLRAHVPHAAADLLAWAAAAGFAGAPQPQIEELLRSTSVFAEDIWEDILVALGFPMPWTEAPASS